MRARATLVVVRGTQDLLDLVDQARDDLVDAGNVAQLDLVVDDSATTTTVEVTLEELDAAGAR
jgi:hypothetical protein